MRFRSRKTEAVYRKRRVLVATLLQDALCAKCQSQRATEVHEVKSRARGGSILDEGNCVALCHECHRWVTENPAAAREQGWLKNSWE